MSVGYAEVLPIRGQASAYRTRLLGEWGERASRDRGYSGDNFAQAVKQICGEQVRVEVIERQSSEFEVLPKRWIVERT